MDKLFENGPAIIREAAASPLGILALMILVVGVLGYVFFGREGISEQTRVVIFLAILAGVAAFGLAVVRALPPPRPPDLVILKAQFGTDKKSCDATGPVKRLCEGKGSLCEVPVGNALCRQDPAYGEEKSLTVEYLCSANQKNASARENEYTTLSCP